MKNKSVQKVYEELVSTYQNLKAEVFVTEILENSDLDLTDIDIFNKSTFSRSYRRDIIDFDLNSYSNPEEKIQFNLARNGIYDILPEGLFHDPIKNKDNQSFKELRQKHKTQEKEARAFFTPLENEFFVQKVKIEQNERTLINKFTDLKNDFLQKFWKLHKDIPTTYSIRLIQLLPYAHNISGDLDLIALSLEKIIDEKVLIKKKYKTIKEVEQKNGNNSELGIDFVLALEETNISYPFLEFTIGPIKKESVDNYTKNGITYKFISIFCDYFLPMEMDSDINITYSDTEESFVLNEINSPRIGLTTII
ncbi:hypothetical protein [Aquimarina sp. 2201CG5-10]|uniref:hypothetical protein n=1 Tax=Aquimarina callyspongiae TaxID=3098150 RepID=UPI002AB5C1EB|nr:hypothetical protein [Aquimarina sp. 2201CG5-10]MDY8138341.1 hypothetical protein [Aquimarina sp. 2201CG5-10]